MDLLVLARDNTGLYRVLKLAERTKTGNVIQALPAAGSTGLHRTWHTGGYVHDRSVNPPSITPTGQIQPTAGAVDECYARHDLVAGQLGHLTPVARVPAAARVIVDLTGSATTQRLEVWYTQPNRLAALEAKISSSADGPFQTRYVDQDGGLLRLVVAFTARAAV